MDGWWSGGGPRQQFLICLKHFFRFEAYMQHEIAICQIYGNFYSHSYSLILMSNNLHNLTSHDVTSVEAKILYSTSQEERLKIIAVSGPTEHCPIFHFPSVLRHRRDITTFLDILTVYTMKTIYFMNAYHLGW